MSFDSHIKKHPIKLKELESIKAELVDITRDIKRHNYGTAEDKLLYLCTLIGGRAYQDSQTNFHKMDS